MIRSSYLLMGAGATLLALSACAAGGEGDDGDGGNAGYGGNGGNGNGTGFGGNGGNGGTGFSGSGGNAGNGGTGFSGSSGFGGTSGSGFGGSSGTGFGGSTGSGFGGSSGTGPAGTAGTGTVGTAGTGSAGTGSGMVTDLIDDLEAGTGSIIAKNNRVGAWYTYNDKTTGGTQTPTAGVTFVVDPGGYMGTKCARTQGMGFTNWGAGMGFDLNNPGTGTKGTYAGAAAYQGIAFMAKGSKFRIKVLIPATTPSAEGGTCSAATGCGDNHGFVITPTADWASYSVPFSMLVQEKWGVAAEFSAASIIGIQFQVEKSVAFDFAIDNIGFY